MNFIQNLIDEIDWSFSFIPEYYVLEKTYEIENQAEKRFSCIQMVNLPGAFIFYKKLNTFLETRFETPPMHVTIFTKGNPLGIGVYSTEELKNLTLRKINDSETR